MPTIGGRTWLQVRNSDNIVKLAYPPVAGTHQECYQAIAKDKELRPAEGVELALLTYNAYTGKDEWKDVKETCFQSNYTRTPNRVLWIPKGFIKGDKSLCGVLVQKDPQGSGLSTKMEVPADFSDWKEQNGIYVKGDLTFVPKDKYALDEMKENNEFAGAILGEEGVGIFVKTAKDANLKPCNWGIDVSDISNPEQRVTLLDEYCYGLRLCGGYCGDYRYDRAFGVFATGEANAQKI